MPSPPDSAGFTRRSNVRVYRALTSERNVGVLLQVLLQLLQVHVLLGGERRGDGRVNAAQVRSGARRAALESPRAQERLRAAGSQAYAGTRAVHGGADGRAEALPVDP